MDDVFISMVVLTPCILLIQFFRKKIFYFWIIRQSDLDGSWDTGLRTKDSTSRRTAEILFSHVGFQELTDCICVCNIIKRLVQGKYRSTYLFTWPWPWEFLEVVAEVAPFVWVTLYGTYKILERIKVPLIKSNIKKKLCLLNFIESFNRGLVYL